MKTITIEGQLRTEIGKKAARQLRSQELVPGVIYGVPKKSIFAPPLQRLSSHWCIPVNFSWQKLVNGKSYILYF